MQKQDVVSIDYFQNPIRFADLINGYIYGGKELIQPEDISEINRMVARIGKKKGAVRTQVITADVMCKVAHEGMRVALVALENQSDIHYAMPVRVMNVESAGYHQQWRRIAKKHQQKKDLRGAEFLSGFSKEDKLIPIITIVVYFGKESWDAPLSIKEMMDLGSYPSEFRNLIEDYHIHLLEVRKYENLDEFHTDIKYVFGDGEGVGVAEGIGFGVAVGCGDAVGCEDVASSALAAESGNSVASTFSTVSACSKESTDND